MTITIQPTDSWPALWKSLKGGETLLLNPKSVYNVNLPSPLEWKAKDVTLDAQGAAVTYTLAVGSSIHKMEAAGCSVKNMRVTPPAESVVFRVYADGCTVDTCTLLAPCATFCFADDGGTDATFKQCNVSKTTSVSIYSQTSGTDILNNVLSCSDREVVVRVDCNSNKVAPDDILIQGNALHSKGGVNLKGAGELRVLGKNCKVIQNGFYDYLRVGQAGMKAFDSSIGDLLISQNAWKLVGPITENLMLMNGNVTVQSNTFLGTHPPVTVAGPLKAAFAGNVYAGILFNEPVPASVVVSGSHNGKVF